MKLRFSLISRRIFLNTLFGGWLAAFCSGTFYALTRFAFPTLGKEPDFVVLNRKDFEDLANNSVKPFPWGGVVGLYFKKIDGSIIALKGVCTHMECNVAYKPAFVFEQARSKKFVMEQPHIPPKYKHLISIAVAAAVESRMCTTVFMKGAAKAGVSKEEIAEAIMVARQARASTIFATAVEGFEELLK
ncbi:MAG: hypothetical protein A3J94_10950 [Syntrophus sp. RIFOXYC2_FULL_54_9]|nr:MAG: hypothetical protein A3J94_10950 [Syntrophus sp. RIFOXYC2_FULL_54_9]